EPRSATHWPGGSTSSRGDRPGRLHRPARGGARSMRRAIDPEEETRRRIPRSQLIDDLPLVPPAPHDPFGPVRFLGDPPIPSHPMLRRRMPADKRSSVRLAYGSAPIISMDRKDLRGVAPLLLPVRAGTLGRGSDRWADMG